MFRGFCHLLVDLSSRRDPCRWWKQSTHRDTSVEQTSSLAQWQYLQVQGK